MPHSLAFAHRDRPKSIFGVMRGLRTGHRFQPSFRQQVLSYMKSATSGQSVPYQCLSALRDRDRLGRVKLVRGTNLHNGGLCRLCIFFLPIVFPKIIRQFFHFQTISSDFLEYLVQFFLPNLRKFQANLIRIYHIRG